jgi:hypothetical protein
MAYTTIDDPSAHFHIQLHTGDGEDSLAITNDANAGDFSPDLLWVKNRTSSGGAGEHMVFDTTRGSSKNVLANKDEVEATETEVLLSFDTDGFSVGSSSTVNQDTSNFVAWQWKANGGTTSSNTDGDYTSTVQANTTAGFSIVKYGDATSFSSSSPATVGHDLGAVPKMIMIKNLDGVRSWGVHHAGLTDAGKIIYLDLTDAEASSSGFMNSTAPTSSVFTVNTLNVANGNNLEYIAYCFAEKQGYSKFGSYEGNGDADGTFVYTGFKPAWILVKRTDNTNGWFLMDNKRSPFNLTNDYLRPNTNDAEGEAANSVWDTLSNGFKLRGTGADVNTSGSPYIYMAFAEHPFVSSEGVPCTAR